MLKSLIKKMILRLYPELAAGTHLPLLAIVTAVPDPPTGGDPCSETTPKYAVDCRLLKNDFTIDAAMPLMRDVPVALAAAAPDRGLALLPQPGTIVEIAFAFGLQTHPYIRAVLPHNLKLPKIDALTMRWQQTADCWQQVDGAGNWSRETPATISDQSGGNQTRQSGAVIKDQAATEHSVIAPKIWTGSQAENLWSIVSEFMQTTAATLAVLAAHTHLGVAPDQSAGIAQGGVAITAQKARLDIIKK